MKSIICFLIITFTSLSCNISSKSAYCLAQSNCAINKINEINLRKNDSEISAIIKFDYGNQNINRPIPKNPDEAKSIVETIRKENKSFYSLNNSLILDKSNFSNVKYSQYSPFAFIKFQNYKDYYENKHLLENLASNKYVNEIYVQEQSEIITESYVNSYACNSYITMAYAKQMMGVNQNFYTGSNVKVGIVDEGMPDKNSGNFSQNQITIYNENTSFISDHTQKVASIIAGLYGVAPCASLYVHRLNWQYDIDDAISYLLGQNVNVINISMSKSNVTNGQYDGYSAYLDYISWNNMVSIVVSAGNNNGDNIYVKNPGMGLNVFSVGSVDAFLNLSYYSLYTVHSSFSDVLMKPTLVAPGEYIYINNTANTYEDSSGTSFAAPMVTGIIALLMDEFWYLMINPQIIMSALIASAKPLPSQTNSWDNECGAGIVNYEQARSLLNKAQYETSILTSSTNIGNPLITKTITIEGEEKISLSVVNHVNSGNVFVSSNIFSPSFTKLRVDVYDSDSFFIQSIFPVQNSNILKGDFTNPDISEKQFQFKVYATSSKVNYYDERVSISLSNHIHSYNHYYEQYTSFQHKSYCSCNDYQLNPHTVRSGSTYIIGFFIYGVCIYCNDIVNVGTTPIVHESVNPIMITNNGSYILPNGIIILVEEDEELYFRSQLIFYPSNQQAI